MAENPTPNIFENAPSLDADGKKNQQDLAAPATQTQTTPPVAASATTPVETPVVATQNQNPSIQVQQNNIVASPALPKIDLTPEQMLFSICAYLDILVSIPVLLQNKDEFVKFHVKQGIFITIIDLVLLIFVAFLAGLFGPTLGDIVFTMFFVLPYFAVHGFLIYQVVKGEKYLLPIIGEHIQKINLPFLNPKAAPSPANPVVPPVSTTENSTTPTPNSK